MQKVIGVTELQRRLHSVLEEVTQKGIAYVLTRDRQPEAVLMPYEAFLRYRELEEQEVLSRFDQLLKRLAERSATYSDEEVAADVEGALEEVRRSCGQ